MQGPGFVAGVIDAAALMLPFMASAAAVADAQVLPLGKTDDLVRSAQICVAIANRQGKVEDLLSDADWDKRVSQTKYLGKPGQTVRARNRNLQMSISYDLEGNCNVIGDMEALKFEGQADVPRSIGTLVTALRDRINETYPVNGMRAGGLKNPIIMTDGFEVEVIALEARHLEARHMIGSTFIISVSLPKPSN